MPASLQGAMGLCAFVLLAYGLSEDRANARLKLGFVGIGLQLATCSTGAVVGIVL